MDHVSIVSTDGHSVMPTDLWPEYLESDFHDYLPALHADNEVNRRTMYPTNDLLMDGPRSTCTTPRARTGPVGGPARGMPTCASPRWTARESRPNSCTTGSSGSPTSVSASSTRPSPPTSSTPAPGRTTAGRTTPSARTLCAFLSSGRCSPAPISTPSCPSSTGWPTTASSAPTPPASSGSPISRPSTTSAGTRSGRATWSATSRWSCTPATGWTRATRSVSSKPRSSGPTPRAVACPR